MIRATVPEASIHEDRDLLGRKDDIRPADGGLRVKAVAVPSLPEETAQNDLRFCVLGPDTRHLLRPIKRHGFAV